jgi:hypothetical protein
VAGATPEGVAERVAQLEAQVAQLQVTVQKLCSELGVSA